MRLLLLVEEGVIRTTLQRSFIPGNISYYTVPNRAYKERKVRRPGDLSIRAR